MTSHVAQAEGSQEANISVNCFTGQLLFQITWPTRWWDPYWTRKSEAEPALPFHHPAARRYTDRTARDGSALALAQTPGG
ncbi:hypothetical protein SBA6_760011 [Candidatus Sulfopaludibacter sp. SbA6]|nr:hypothetical protein SBA6_760011 [Candidatus Sulfopaludibacter sp. SbA6]